MKHAALLACSIVLFGCAGGARSREADSSASAGEPVAVAVVPASELRALYGRTFDDNPFLVPKSMVTRKSVDFIVLRLTVAGPAEMQLLQADAADEAGETCATFYAKREFTELAMILSGPSSDNLYKQNEIGWYYLPSEERVRVRAGSHPYLLVLVGKPPFPKTVMVRVRLLVGADEHRFEIPVTFEQKK
jgi:hypothetical protein